MALLGMVATVGPAGRASAASAAAPEESAAARLAVDTSELGTVGPVVRQRVLERGGQVFRDAGVAAGDEGDPRVSVVVRDGPDEEGFAFEIRLEVDGRTDSASRWQVDCQLCTETELIDRVAEELEKVTVSLVTLASSQAEAQAREPETPPVAEAAADRRDPSSTASSEPPRSDTGLHGWTKAGIGTAVAGVVVAGVGVGLVLLPAKPLADDPLRERFTQPPGYALLAVGGAAMIAGAVLIGVGVKRSKSNRVAVSPAGVVVRF